jgi:hypothetical protein
MIQNKTIQNGVQNKMKIHGVQYKMFRILNQMIGELNKMITFQNKMRFSGVQNKTIIFQHKKIMLITINKKIGALKIIKIHRIISKKRTIRMKITINNLRK